MTAALRRVLVLGVCWAAVVGGAGVASAGAETKAKACHPRVGAEGKARFTVWYCQGDGLGQAATKVVARLLDDVWARETRREPNGLGPPVTPAANGGRISVYVTAPDEVVHLGKCPEFCKPVDGDYGFATPVAPFSKNRAGGLSSSGALVINEKKGLNDATVIHEFFHVLQFAHNWPAVGTWLGEAMATWSEHKFGAEDTSRLHFFKEFQRHTADGLSGTGGYGAYVWLIWLAQHTRSDQSVFELWSAIERARATQQTLPPQRLHGVIDKRAFDHVLREYLAKHKLSWAKAFRSFAIEDLNPVPPLSPQVTPDVFGRGPFGDPLLDEPLLGFHPDFVGESTLAVGTHRIAVAGLAELGAQYQHISQITNQVKAVTVTSHGMKPWGDLVVLASTPSGWERRNLQDGSVSFCGSTNREQVTELYLIADNHDDQNPHSGARYTVSAKPSCP